jgi:hypothetical protein
VDSQNFREQLQKAKPFTLKSSLYNWKVIETYMSKMGLHDLFGHLQHKLWPKEKPGTKLPTTESWESTKFPCVQVTCDTSLESSRQGLQLQFRPHPDQRSTEEVVVLQSCRIPSLSNFGTPGTKSHSNATFARRYKLYYMGEGGDFPRVWAVVSLVSPRSPVAFPNTKGAPTLC